MKLSLSDSAISEAKQIGYTATDAGDIFNPLGKLVSNRSKKKAGHLSITLNLGDRKKSVLAHRFIAYFFYGDEIFNHQCVRHLNDVPWDNRLSNLRLGTFKENRADIPKEKISGPAKKHAHKLVFRSRKLTDEEVLAMRKERQENNTPYHKIGPKFGVTTMTAYRAINMQSWKEVK